MHNILDYGAVNNAEVNSTAAIQKAVDACNEAGGGVVYVPYGTYMVASIHLYSHVHFIFEPGATFLGSLDPDDFDQREPVDYPLYQDFSHSFFHRSMFWAEDCEDISFCGNATIDLREVWEKPGAVNEELWRCARANKIFALKNCKMVVISDLKLYNSTDLAVYLAGCENVRITGLTMWVNIDGISPDCCKNVVISDCHVVAGDDAIVPKSSYTLNENRLCENITITNCTVSSRMCAIKFGTETNGGFKNITVSNCTIYDTCYTGLALEIADGGEMDGIICSNITMKNVGSPFIIMLTDRRRAPEGAKEGTIKNVILENIIAIGPYGYIKPIRYTGQKTIDEVMKEPRIIPSSVTGLPNSKLENILLSNIYLTLPGGMQQKSEEIIPKEPIKATPAAGAYGMLPASGIFFRHINGIKLNNINVSTLEPDAREALIFDDVENLTVQ